MAKKPYVYGSSPNPKSWHECAEIIKSNTSKPKKSVPKDKK